MLRYPAFLLVPLLLTLVTTTGARPSGRVKICGQHLADFLAVICDGRGYNDPFSAAVPTTGSTKRSTDAVLAASSSAARGVADECCKKSCTYRTMEQYCSPRQSPDPRSLSRSEEARPVLAKPRGFLNALVDQRVEEPEQQTTTEAAPPFRVGVINSYFNGFVLPPSNRQKSFNVSESLD